MGASFDFSFSFGKGTTLKNHMLCFVPTPHPHPHPRRTLSVVLVSDCSLSLSLSADCDMLADDTTLHTSGKDIMQIRSNMQDSLDQVSNWCDNNHMVIHPIKTKSMTISTRQKHQLSPLPLYLVLNGAKIDQVSEYRLLGIT